MTLKRMTDSGRLVDVAPLVRDHYLTSTDLVPVTAEDCPRCGSWLNHDSVWQDALVRHGGYGGTRRVDTDWCDCGFERVVAVSTERPPR